MKDILAGQFNVADMGPGMKRGMVLNIYKSKVAEAAGKPAARNIRYVKLSGTYENPDLIIYCNNHAVVAHINMHRLQILQLINERMKSDFIRSIRVRQ